VKGFGALFFVDASYGGNSLSQMVLQAKKLFVNHIKSDTSNVTVLRAPKLKVHKSDSNKQEKEAFKQLLNQLKQTIVDYGRTLKSISSGESIFLIVNFIDDGNFPHTVNLLMKKSVLQAYN